MKKKIQKTSRQSLAKKIFAEPDLIKKHYIAYGQSIDFGFLTVPESDLDIFAFVRRARWLLKSWREQRPKMRAAAVSSIGAVILTLIGENDHKFFSRLAAIIQFDRKPGSPHKLYCDILRFCHGCFDNGFSKPQGTSKNPCDGMALTAYLKSRGHRFSGYENQVPRTLRAACKKLGIVLTGQR
jgi:hypothetical protein